MPTLVRTLKEDELGRYIANLDSEIIHFARQIPKFEGVNILLRFEDAFDNLMSETLIQLRAMDDSNNQYRVTTFDYTTQSIALIYEALQIMLVEGKTTTGRLIGVWPAIEFFVGYYKVEDNAIEECKRIGFLQEGDFYDSFDLPSAAIGDAKCNVVLKLISANFETKQYAIDLVWKLLEEIRKKNVCKTALHSKGQVEVDRNDNIVNAEFGAGLRERIASHRSFGSVQRTFSSMVEPFRWASDFTEKGDKAMSTIRHGLSTEANIQAMAEETKELKDAYEGFPRFRQSFSKMTGYRLNEFITFTTHLENLARRHGIVGSHAIYDARLDELYSDCRSLKLRDSALRRLFESLTWRSDVESPTFPLYVINDRCLFSMRQIMLTKLDRPTGIFERYLDSEVKGRYFEAHCRRLLRKAGLKTFPSRIPVGQFLPTSISFNLWGSQKTKSDIDILTASEGFLFVIECKDMKKPKWRRPGLGRSRQRNILINASVENYYKSRWLYDRFETKTLRQPRVDLFLSKAKFQFVVPLTVTNLEIRIQGTTNSAAVISLGDLMTICRETSPRIAPDTASEGHLKVGVLSSEERLTTPIITPS